MELKLSKINEGKDRIEHVKELLKKISYGLETMSVEKEEGNSRMTLDQIRSATFSSNNNDDVAISNSKIHLLKIYLIGNAKDEFHILGRSGYCFS